MSIIKVCKTILIDAWIKINSPEAHNKIRVELLNISDDSLKEKDNEEIMKSNISK